MEWIEVSARTLDEARELALDRLGVVGDELEYEIIEEPRGGLFGLGRTDARIRARVKPLSREKPPDRRRRRSTERRPSGSARSRAAILSSRSGEPAPRRRPARMRQHAPARMTRTGPQRADLPRLVRGGVEAGGGARVRRVWRRHRILVARGPRDRAVEDRPEAKMDGEPEAQDLDVEAQAEHAAQFAGSLVDAMGLKGSAVARVEDETVLVAIDGEGLGLLVGPGGKTLRAIEELVRAVVQHGLSGRSARLRVDVGGYRERRREALAAFARQVAEEVRANNLERALEPMNPPDRKVVHDAVAEIDGVATSSEGEEPRRRVVISPA